ncbi:uncharacterized protein METZ01_LOCUS165998, partial [marine metagenome]
ALNPSFTSFLKQGVNMKKIVLLSLIIIMGCEDTKQELIEENQLVFIASEGNYGSNNGSISVFRDGKEIQQLKNIGDVLQSIFVHNDKLIVALNNSHFLKFYEITVNGLLLPGIEISTDNSSPREMVIINNKLYFSNWNTKDVKVLNLLTYAIESSIPFNGLPEDIVTDGTYLYVSIPNLELYDTNKGTHVVKIDTFSEQIIETYEVGRGPMQLLINNNQLWISRTYYSEDWTQTIFGSSLINLETNEVITKEYGTGVVCGGDIMKITNGIYRTFEGGVASVNDNLSIDGASKIGAYPTYKLYSAGAENDHIFFGITSDYESPDTVFVHDNFSNLKYILEVGASPGDYGVWNNQGN